MSGAYPFLDLSGCRPVRGGGRRHVFVHPTDPNLLVKVERAGWHEAGAATGLKRIKRRLMPGSARRAMLAEVRQARAVERRATAGDGPTPIPRFHGFVRTALGRGGLHQRIVSEEGGDVPNLAELRAGQGMLADPDLLASIADLMRRLRDFGVVVTDIHPSNIVLSRSGDGLRGTLIDGYGDRAAIPVRSLSGRLNAAKLSQRAGRLAAALGLTWDAARWTFLPGVAPPSE
jgi:hypothetical protein